MKFLILLILVLKNLVLKNFNKTSEYFIGKNFLSTSQYLKTDKLEKVKNLHFSRIKDFSKYNTLIIDGEGVEEHFLNNLNRIKNIRYIIFEMHNNILSPRKIKNLFNNLKKNNFVQIDKCFNSFYFKKEK